MMNQIFIFFLMFSAKLLTAQGEFTFPKDFKFGVATASYQIEGGWNASGKGENIWDRVTHENPNWVRDGRNGDVACDSYDLWRDDLVLLKNLGVQVYRFSLSWSRLLPTGFAHRINPDGVRYYNNIIDDLLQNNIEPIVTLYHWDLPQPLQDLGGWPNPLLARYFEEYAKIAFTLFGDRVKTWISFNEPPEICESSYGQGDDAPAILSPGFGDYLCGHTVLLAHAKVYHLYNITFKPVQKGIIGITINSVWGEPKTNSTADVLAAERAMQMKYGWWAHPIFSEEGDYPTIMKERIANISKLENFPCSRLPEFTAHEVKLIRSTFDFLGLNHYSTWLVSDAEFDPSSPTSHPKDMGVKLEQDPSWEPSAATWLKVVPWGFRKLLNWIKKEYNNPLTYITENGFADKGELNDLGRINYYQVDAVYTDFSKTLDKVHHPALFIKLENYGVHGNLLRWLISYLTNRSQFVAVNISRSENTTVTSDVLQESHGYLKALLDAMYLDDCNVKAYIAWSLIDNMEWRDGYTLKFGLTFVDFNDPKRSRTPKASTNFFKELTATRSVPENIITPVIVEV